MIIVKRVLAIIVILAIFASGVTFFNSVIPTLAEISDESKITGLLILQIEAKLRAVEAGGVAATSEDSLQAVHVDKLRTPGIRLDDLNKQRIFIHFAQEPTHSQIEELEAMGIIPYLDSWIPPVGAHPTGFIIADMPVDRLQDLASKDYVIRLDTAERTLEPDNDLATQKTNANDVWDLGYNGTSVRIAILDTGLDTSHPDIPTPVVGKDYSNYPTVSDDIVDTSDGHGTHVTGCALGRGTQSSGVYKGSAPDADLIFLKIYGGNLTWYDAAIQAIHDAVDLYDADIITMSSSDWFDYHDGTSQIAQAVDYAVSQGAVYFNSAGNRALDDQHYSGTVAASSSTSFIRIDVAGAGSGDKRTALAYNLVWYDGTDVSNDLELQYYNSSYTLLASTNQAQEESSRGTESEYSAYNLYVSDGTYYLKVKNKSSTSQFFHIYYDDKYNFPDAGSAKFASPDPDYTLCSPADADSAIAVGAYTTRKYWWDYKNNGWHYTSGETVDQICTFSSRGPRVDTGAPPKPNIVAPGSAIISCRDNDVLPLPPGGQSDVTYAPFIDNDGPNESSATKNDGNGPADYYVMEGTSMASPHAAGVAALILDKNPGWTPAQVKDALESTAVDKGAAGWDEVYGWGLIDALAAIGTAANTPPQVTNVTAYQSSPTVNISYDVSDAEQSDVTISFEYWDGSSWQACTTTTGEGTQSTGTGKSGTWDAKADFDEHYMTDCKIKVTADDGQAENNTGTGESSTFILDTKDPSGYGCSSPTNGDTNVSVNPNLTCFSASDDSPPVSYYFQLAEDGAFSVPLQESDWQSSTTWSPSTLDHDKQYFWRVKAKDNYDNESGYNSTFDFNTESVHNTPPVLSDGLVSPASGYVTTNFTYSVTYSDADNDPPASPTLSIDGGGPIDMTEVDSEDTDYTDGKDYQYTTSGLAKDITHTYQFAASDGVDDATGDTGSHDGPTVQNSPPNTPSNPSPANNATPITINADLIWTGGDPDAGDTVTYDVYFGISSSPPLVSNNQSGTTYDPGTLAYNTTYYWRIVARDNHGAESTGPVWWFSTGELLLGDANGDGIIDTGDITKIKRIYFGIDDPTPCADANMDGIVDTGDITKVKRIYFELDDPTPCAHASEDGKVDTQDMTTIKAIYFEAAD